MNDENRVNIVLAGRGGQGILFATTVLEKAALARGDDVIGSETHGMAQRGGSVVSHLKLGGAAGPLVPAGEAHIVLSLERTETFRVLRFLRPGGACLANIRDEDGVPDKVLEGLEAMDVSFFRLDADAVARRLGAPQAANVAMLGLLASWPGAPFSKDELREALGRSGAERFRETNLAVFEKGLEQAKADLGS